MINRVVVGIDFSDPSRTALNQAAAWAQRLEKPLVAVHVLQSPEPMPYSAQIPLDPAWLDAMETQALDNLKQWTQAFPNSTVVVKWGSPAKELVALADPDSLLVVSQVGHSGIANFLFGGTASRVVQHAPCDVLVVRREKQTSRKPPKPLK